MEDELRRRIEATDTSNQIRSVLRDLGDLKTIDSKVESLTDDLRATAKDSHVEAVRGDLRRMSEANGEQFARMIESLQRLLDATVTLEDLLRLLDQLEQDARDPEERARLARLKSLAKQAAAAMGGQAVAHALIGLIT